MRQLYSARSSSLSTKYEQTPIQRIPYMFLEKHEKLRDQGGSSRDEHPRNTIEDQRSSPPGVSNRHGRLPLYSKRPPDPDCFAANHVRI